MDWLINYGKIERGIIIESKDKGYWCITECGNECYTINKAEKFNMSVCPKCGKTILADYELIRK